jgi:acetyl esterase/lipase
MQSLKSRVYYHLTRRALAKSRRLKLTIPQGRLAREQQSLRKLRMPAGMRTERCEVAGVAAEWLRPHGAGDKGRVLYLHGGAYVFGSTVTHRGIASAMAAASRQDVLNIDYRLAPENPFPAALDDAVAVYRALMQMHPGQPIAVAGDSAGGGLALALALRARDEGLQPPSALALMSPWTDLTLSLPTHQSKANVDPYFPDSALLKGAAASYAANTPLNNPFLSPLFADLSGLPAVMIHVGEREALLDDSTVLAKKINAQGGAATLRVFPQMWHVWQLLAGRMPEADASLAELGDFVQQSSRRDVA